MSFFGICIDVVEFGDSAQRFGTTIAFFAKERHVLHLVQSSYRASFIDLDNCQLIVVDTVEFLDVKLAPAFDEVLDGLPYSTIGVFAYVDTVNYWVASGISKS
ncbi:hypothetical protein [Halorarum halobium]|uniref:hypothetical protein n=1 Tax=Halorarum halobium TaxID=3075121 RepID=UPI0028A7EFDA|nr:hypothetical protein [Halobaculum sp. XH14]